MTTRASALSQAVLPPIDRSAPFDAAVWVAAAELRGYTLEVVCCLTTGAQSLRRGEPVGHAAPDKIELFYWLGDKREVHERNLGAVIDYLVGCGRYRSVPLARGSREQHAAARARFGGA
ncbi:MAG: hypothetical protein WDO24_05750 [Pseudomonadota bacterium]